MAPGPDLSYAIGSDGNVYGWGANPDSELGTGSNATELTTPAKVELPSGVTATAIEAGNNFAFAIGSNGNIYAWGGNAQGELGDGSSTYSAVPVKVSLPAGVTATSIAAYDEDGYAIGSDGNLYAWGDNAGGELGIGNGTGPQKCDAPTNSACTTTPVRMDLPSGVSAQLISGDLFSGSDGHAYILGWSSNGLPEQIALPAGVRPTALAGGQLHNMVAGSDGKVYAWGDDSLGELGNGTFGSLCCSFLPAPVVTSMPSGVSAVALATPMYGGLAIGSDGKLYTWGDNADGQLGIGEDTGPSTCYENAICSDTPVVGTLPTGDVPEALGQEPESFGDYVIAGPANPVTVTSVKFSGRPKHPKITIKGKGFGTKPAGLSDNTTSCGTYKKNGDDFGSGLSFTDVGKFGGGSGTPPSGSCIGLIVTKWTATTIVFHFGDAYDTFGSWIVAPGDQFQIAFGGTETSGAIAIK